MRASGGICAAAKAGCAFAKHGAASQSVCESYRMTVVAFCRNLGQEPICLCRHVLLYRLCCRYTVSTVLSPQAAAAAVRCSLPVPSQVCSACSSLIYSLCTGGLVAGSSLCSMCTACALGDLRAGSFLCSMCMACVYQYCWVIQPLHCCLHACKVHSGQSHWQESDTPIAAGCVYLRLMTATWGMCDGGVCELL